jgi:hypothetical protein
MQYYVATMETQVSNVKVPVSCRFVETTNTDGQTMFLISFNKRINDLGFDDCFTLARWIPNLKRELAAEFYHPNFIKVVVKHVVRVRKEVRGNRKAQAILRQMQLHDID